MKPPLLKSLTGFLVLAVVACTASKAQQFTSRMSTQRFTTGSKTNFQNCYKDETLAHIFPTFPTQFSADSREECIDQYYQTAQSLSYFNQIQTSYNALSASTNLGANIASYNFNNGMQLGLNFSAIAGSSNCSSSGSNSTSTTCSSSTGTQNTPPTLTTAAAAQAAQNLLSSGNVAASVLYPVFSFGDLSTDRWALKGNFVAREGVDLQSFTIGTSTSATNPNTHFNSWLEANWQYDADPSSPGSTSAATIFVRGMYGLNYLSSGYAREYGFMSTKDVLNKQGPIAIASVGIMVHGQYTISVSKGFGPAQYYIDSTKGNTSPTVYNNFRTLSFGITYQQKSGTP